MKTANRAGAFWVATLLACAAHAQEAKEADPTEGFKFEPLMLEAKGGTGNVFGVNFQFKKAWVKTAGIDQLIQEKVPTRAADAKSRGLLSCGSFQEEEGKVIPSWVAFTDCAGEVYVKGTATADADKNPNKLVDASGSYSWVYTTSSRKRTNMFALGGQAKYETDQSFDNQQYVYGLRGTFTDLPGCAAGVVCDRMNFLGLSLGIQRVDPSKDKARKAALGGGAMEPYERAEFEGFYKFYLPSQWRYLSDVEFNYRHFQELDPSDTIRRAGLQRHRLGLVRLNFGWGGKGATAVDPSMFIQYSRGSLPFDTKAERVVKVGLQFQVF